MIRDECDQCGERNTAGALFCTSCKAYLGWEQTITIPPVGDAAGTPPTAGAPAPFRAVPPAPAPPPAPETAKPQPVAQQLPAADRLRTALSPTEITIMPSGEPVSVEIAVHNLSNIVDAYVVEVPGAPDWLEVGGSQVRLMPQTSGTLRLTLGIRTGILPVAQTTTVPVQVRSEISAGLTSVRPLAVSVPQVGRPVVLRVEPSVIRVKDQPGGEFRVVADNSANNHAVHLQLGSHDAEQVMAVAFRSPVLDIPAGHTMWVQARVEAPLPEPGQETSRQLTVSAFDGKHTTQAVVTFAQRTSIPVAEPPLALRLHPSVVQATDSPAAQLQLEIDNSAGRQGARVTLSAHDPEGSVHFRFTPEVVDVAPGATVGILVRLDAPLPEPGGEATRPFTLVARYGARAVETSGTFRQRTSAAALNAIKLRVEPPIVRVHDSARGRMRVVADNRMGTQPARMWLAGRDHEGTASLTFTVPYLDVYPGQQASADVEIKARRPASGVDSTRGFTITASDGRYEVSAEGTFAQTSSDRRPLWRTVFTLLGGLAMIIGALLPWTRQSGRTGFQWTAKALAEVFDHKDPRLNAQLARIACAGTVIVFFALLAVWGRLGPKGRLTRLSALLALLILIAFLIVLGVRAGDGAPNVGAIVIIAGCLSAYVGGHLARR